MKKIKDLFEKFLFTVEEVEEVVEDKPQPEPIVEPVPEKRPLPKPRMEALEKPIVKKRNEPIREEEYEPSPMITLTKEIPVPVLGDEKPEEKKEPVKQEKAEEKKIEPELPKIPENKPKAKVEQDKNAEPYITSAIISPMFGKKEKEAKPVKKKRREIVMPDSELGEKKSILGTVFSPLYGDKNESDNVPRDEVDPSVANLSVKDFLNEAKPEKKAEQPKAEEKVLPIREEVKKPEPVEEYVEEPIIEDMEPVSMTREEFRISNTVTPFGTNVTKKKNRINIHEAWGTQPQEEEKETERYENISLFDLDDKM
jgi:hypothetical protein